MPNGVDQRPDGVSQWPDGVSQWIEQAIPAGSGRYYALLHADPQWQQRQKLITALISIFSKLGFQSQEIEVAKHKLEWWRHELQNTSFQHPVTNALQAIAPTEDNSDRLIQLLNGYGALLEQGSPASVEANDKFHLDTGANACHLLCGTTENHPVVTRAGNALSKLRCYRYLRQHVEKGLLCIPMSTLESAGVSSADLSPASNNVEVAKFFHHSTDTLQKELLSCQTELEQGLKAITSDERLKVKPVYVYLMLQKSLLNAISKDGCQLLDKEVRLTPIRNFWIAMRAARRFDKL